MDVKQTRIAVWCVIIILAFTSAFLSGCAPLAANTFIKPSPIEDVALEKAVIMCEKFGHMPNTADFIKCAEERYDEYILNNR